MLHRNKPLGKKLRSAFYENNHLLGNSLRQINELRGDIAERFGFLPRFVIQQKTEGFLPRFDVFEKQSAYQVSIEVPGMTADEILLTAGEASLGISGEKSPRTDEARILFLEQLGGQFSRVLRFDLPIESKDVTAKLNNGVLWITVPKASAVVAEPGEVHVPIEEGN